MSEDNTEQPTPAKVQWKVGDIFAPADPSYGSPVAIIQAPDTITEYCMVGISEVNGLMSVFCFGAGVVCNADTMTRMLTKANARKIGELSWNILEDVTVKDKEV